MPKDIVPDRFVGVLHTFSSIVQAMTTHVAAAALVGVLLIAGGCVTAPEATPAPKQAVAAVPESAPTAPALTAPVMAQPTVRTDAPKEMTSVESPETPLAQPKLSAETTALIERLTHGSDADTLPHEVADTTSFPSALHSLQPGAPPPKAERSPSSYNAPARGLTADGNSTALIERDWTGLVLVPISTSLSKAYTSDVQLIKVEAHPLNDGRVRVWTRVHNVGKGSLPADIACEFRMKGSQASSPYFYQFEVPGDDYRDVFFVSPDGQLSSYTVLVRSTMAGRR